MSIKRSKGNAKLPRLVSVRGSSVDVRIRRADDSALANAVGSDGKSVQIARAVMGGPGITGGTNGEASGNAPIAGNVYGGEIDIEFEIWNNTGGPFKAQLEIPNAEPPFHYLISGSTDASLLWPVWSAKVTVKRRASGT